MPFLVKIMCLRCLFPTHKIPLTLCHITCYESTLPHCKALFSGLPLLGLSLSPLPRDTVTETHVETHTGLHSFCSLTLVNAPARASKQLLPFLRQEDKMTNGVWCYWKKFWAISACALQPKSRALEKPWSGMYATVYTGELACGYMWIYTVQCQSWDNMQGKWACVSSVNVWARQLYPKFPCL